MWAMMQKFRVFSRSKAMFEVIRLVGLGITVVTGDGSPRIAKCRANQNVQPVRTERPPKDTV
jgi:hypothetical protein